MHTRIRTIKPEFFTHHALWLAEQEEKLPLRIAFAGLWICCDREGRFRWRPEELKLHILPYDKIDFSRVLDALVTRGFVVKYGSNDALYGCIPSFSRHQVINNKERQSELPSPTESDLSTRAPRVPHACPTEIDAWSELKSGTEGKGIGTEGNGTNPPNPPRGNAADNLFAQFWSEYPRRENPRKARAAWLKIKPDENELAEILGWLSEAKQSDQWQDKSKIPHASTFLNQRRWEGEPPPSNGSDPRKTRPKPDYSHLNFEEPEDNAAQPLAASSLKRDDG